MRVPASELSRNFSQYCDVALTKPLIVTKNGRDRLVLLSIEEYEMLRDLVTDRSRPAVAATKESQPGRHVRRAAKRG